MSDENGSRAYGSPSHRPDCQCAICLRIRKAIDEGKPSKRAQSEAAKLRQAEERGRQLEREKAKEGARIAREAAAAAASAVQLAQGKEPDQKLTEAIAKSASVLAGQGERGKMDDATLERFIQMALKEAGVDLSRLALVSSGGLGATLVKTATHEGQITDEKEYIDWPTRHKYLETMLRVFGFLKQDEAPMSGGLVMIMGEGPKRDASHPLDCSCADCERAFRSAMADSRRDQLKRETDANIIDVPARLP